MSPSSPKPSPACARCPTPAAPSPQRANTPPCAPAATPKGRGTVWALQHRFDERLREPFDDGWADGATFADPADPAGPGRTDGEAARGAPPRPVTRIVDEQARRVLARNHSPDIGFDLSLNPYRGCEHGCIYCYARPTHSYLNLSPGLDFETHILAKRNAAERLRAELMSPSYQPALLNIGSATDAYQPAERRLGITRGLIGVLAEFQHPFTIVTKSALVERDLDLIAPMALGAMAAVHVSITTLDAGLAARLEPRAAAPHRRLKTIERLARAGVPVGVSTSPMIPFVNEPELERILQAAADAGATSAFCIVIRLPWEVAPLFQAWLHEHLPQRAGRVMARIREMRSGRDNDPNFGTRMRGTGIWADLLRQRFDKACARLGLNRERPALDLTRFRRPSSSSAAPPPAGGPRQATLF